MFSRYKYLHFLDTVRFGGGAHANSAEIGTLAIKRRDGTTVLKNTLNVPDLGVTLISVSHLTKSTCKVLFGGDTAYVYRGDENKLMLPASVTTDSIYAIDVCVAEHMVHSSTLSRLKQTILRCFDGSRDIRNCSRSNTASTSGSKNSEQSDKQDSNVPNGCNSTESK